MIDLNLLKQGDLVRKEMRRGPTSIIDFYIFINVSVQMENVCILNVLDIKTLQYKNISKGLLKHESR